MEELKALGEGLFPNFDHPWREKFFGFIEENASTTFHHATTHDRIHIVYCLAQDKGMWFLPGSGMGPLQGKRSHHPKGDRREEVMQGRVCPGHPQPLGANFCRPGVNFALFSENATKVELCLFDSPDVTVESHRITLPEKTDQVWHGFLPDLKPGQIYGYRVQGPYEPARGHRFNPRKLLIDPYAKAIARELRWDEAVLDPERDTAHSAPLARVVDAAFDWQGDLLKRNSVSCSARRPFSSRHSRPD